MKKFWLLGIMLLGKSFVSWGMNNSRNLTTVVSVETLIEQNTQVIVTGASDIKKIFYRESHGLWKERLSQEDLRNLQVTLKTEKENVTSCFQALPEKTQVVLRAHLRKSPRVNKPATREEYKRLKEQFAVNTLPEPLQAEAMSALYHIIFDAPSQIEEALLRYSSAHWLKDLELVERSILIKNSIVEHKIKDYAPLYANKSFLSENKDSFPLFFQELVVENKDVGIRDEKESRRAAKYEGWWFIWQAIHLTLNNWTKDLTSNDQD